MAAALLCCAACQAPQQGESPGSGARVRSILLITIDTLRADRLGAYGDTTARTPVMDGLAARGVRAVVSP